MECDPVQRTFSGLGPLGQEAPCLQRDLADDPLQSASDRVASSLKKALDG